LRIYFNRFIFLIIVSLIYTSCVVSVPCKDSEFSILLISENPAREGLLIKLFQKGSNFKNPLDSFILNKSNCIIQTSSDTTFFEKLINGKQIIESSFDYQLILNGQNKKWQISEIIENNKMRKAGFFSGDTSCRNVIESYKIDDLKIEAQGSIVVLRFSNKKI
jgi:hypothetical protein